MFLSDKGKDKTVKNERTEKTAPANEQKSLIQRMKGMSPMERVEYIAAYYWGRILLAVFLVIALIWGVKWAGKLQNNTIFYVALMDSSYSAGEVEEFCQGFAGYLGEDDPHNVVRMDTSLIYLPPSQSGTQLYNAYLNKELMLEGSGLDVYLTPVEFYQENRGREEMFLPLDQVLGEEYDFYADHILDGTALVLEDCRLTREEGAKYSPIYLTVPAGAEHPEKILAFIHYLTELNG